MSYVARWVLSVFLSVLLSMVAFDFHGVGAAVKRERLGIPAAQHRESESARVDPGQFGLCVQLSLPEFDVRLRNQSTASHVQNADSDALMSLCFGGRADEDCKSGESD